MVIWYHYKRNNQTAGLLRYARNDIYAFTLAEVLITLGIVGVVAALILPGVIQGFRKREVETHLAHSFAVVSQALKRAEADYGDSTGFMRDYAGSNDVEGVAEYFTNTYLMPYLHGAILREVGGYGLLKLGYNDRNYDWPTGNLAILMPDGSILFINVNIGRQGIPSIVIGVDINGPMQPNISGRDYFQMFFSLYNGELFMGGEKFVTGYGLDYNVILTDEEILSRCGGDPKHLECGAVIRRNNWKIPDNYPLKF